VHLHADGKIGNKLYDVAYAYTKGEGAGRSVCCRLQHLEQCSWYC